MIEYYIPVDTLTDVRNIALRESREAAISQLYHRLNDAIVLPIRQCEMIVHYLTLYDQEEWSVQFDPVHQVYYGYLWIDGDDVQSPVSVSEYDQDRVDKFLKEKTLEGCHDPEDLLEMALRANIIVFDQEHIFSFNRQIERYHKFHLEEW